MIRFSSAPLQSDMNTLMSLSKKDDQMLKALDASDIDRISSTLEKSALVPKKVLVHSKDGKIYWSTRHVNPAESNPEPKSEVSNPSQSKSAGLLSSKGKLSQQNLWGLIKPTSTQPTQPTQPKGNKKDTTYVYTSHGVVAYEHKPKSVDSTNPHESRTQGQVTLPGVSQHIQDHINSLYQDSDSDSEFFENLESTYGLTWKEVPGDNKGNVERAMMAIAMRMTHKRSSKSANLSDKEIMDQHRVYTDKNDTKAMEFIKNLPKVRTRDGVSKISSVAKDSKEYHDIEALFKADERDNLKFQIRGIYRIDSLPVDNKFQQIVQQNAKYAKETVGGKNCQKDIFFHGTNFRAISSILSRQGQMAIPETSDEGNGGSVLGKGIYLAYDPFYAAHYTDMGLFFGVNAPATYVPKTDENGYAHTKGVVLICEASLGETKDTSKRKSIAKQPVKIDSVYADENSNLLNINAPQVCVYNSQAVRPKYIVDLHILAKTPG